jgi:hypothetical protein
LRQTEGNAFCAIFSCGRMRIFRGAVVAADRLGACFRFASPNTGALPEHEMTRSCEKISAEKTRGGNLSLGMHAD